MSSGARQITQIARETTVGVTPTPFARTTFEFTDNGLDATVSKEESKSITSGRIARSSMITGAEYAGELKCEAKYSQLVQDLMAAAAFNSWSSNVLTEPYRVCRRVNILRDYPDDKTKLYPR
ncbi:phage tail tube protein, partial [Acinetobacter baumannii]|uniref:phage tail tube protein n=1 Tax=Acinetobacter baumannii TaxID=470 RepID=UPI001FF229A4